MTERKYSVSEITQMRSTLHRRFAPWGGGAFGFQESAGMYAERVMREAMLVEEQVRTYMLNGTDPDELETKQS